MIACFFFTRKTMPIKPISAKRAVELREYQKEKKLWLKEHRCCERCGSHTDTNHVVIDLHHVRGRVGKLLRAQHFWMPLCRQCHNWVHENPTPAREQGFLAELGDWNRYEDDQS